MSKHHHHPREGHSEGTPPDRKRPRHNWFFYISCFFVLIALLAFIYGGIPARTVTAPPPPAPAAK